MERGKVDQSPNFLRNFFQVWFVHFQRKWGVGWWNDKSPHNKFDLFWLEIMLPKKSLVFIQRYIVGGGEVKTILTMSKYKQIFWEWLP